MRLNQSVRYGVACLFELSKNTGEYVEAEQLARSLAIPSAYAHKVLQTMARAGLVEGVKGSGYCLARPLARISALEVMEALTKEGGSAFHGSEACHLLEKRINDTLGSFTLAELKIVA